MDNRVYQTFLIQTMMIAFGLTVWQLIDIYGYAYAIAPSWHTLMEQECSYSEVTNCLNSTYAIKLFFELFVYMLIPSLVSTIVAYKKQWHGYSGSLKILGVCLFNIILMGAIIMWRTKTLGIWYSMAQLMILSLLIPVSFWQNEQRDAELRFPARQTYGYFLSLSALVGLLICLWQVNVLYTNNDGFLSSGWCFEIDESGKELNRCNLIQNFFASTNRFWDTFTIIMLTSWLMCTASAWCLRKRKVIHGLAWLSCCLPTIYVTVVYALPDTNTIDTIINYCIGLIFVCIFWSVGIVAVYLLSIYFFKRTLKRKRVHQRISRDESSISH